MTAVGSGAAYSATTANNMTAIGLYAGYYLTTGNDNTFIGGRCFQAATTAGTCTGVGFRAAYNATTGDNNAIYGYEAGYAMTDGSENTFIGTYSGRDLTTGINNTCIGYRAGDDHIGTDHNNQLYIANNNSGAGNDKCWIYGDNNGACTQGNNSSSWSTTSDRRLKKNIVDSPKGLAEINQIRVTNFEFRVEDEIDMDEFPLADGPHQVVLGGGQEGQVQTGVIAQEIEDILPECIRVSEKGAKTVKNDPITWALVKAVQELSAKVTALENV